MNKEDAPRYFQAAGESQADIAHRDRHGIAIDDHQPTFRINNQAGAVIKAIGDARNCVWHIEIDHDQRWRQPPRTRIAVTGNLGTRRLRRSWRRAAFQLPAGPHTQFVIANTVLRRKPAPVHANHAQS